MESNKMKKNDHLPRNKESTIQLVNGYLFDAFEPDFSVVDLKSIATGCSNKGRFCGQTKSFYSVLEHQINVGLFMYWKNYYDNNRDPLISLIGHHHDDSEGVMADIPTPTKVQPEFQFWVKLEDKVQNGLYKKYVGIEYLLNSEKEFLKEADKVLLLTEAKELMPNYHEYEKRNVGYKPLKYLATRKLSSEIYHNPVMLRNIWIALHKTYKLEMEYGEKFISKNSLTNQCIDTLFKYSKSLVENYLK